MRRAWRTAAIVALALAAAFGYLRLAEREGYALRIGSAAPGFRLQALAGGETSLESLRGRVVVLNFWATWCPPCISEMPSLERLHRALAAEGLSVVAVAADDDAADLRAFVARAGLTLPVLHDPGGRVAAGDYHTTGYPETFVIDRSGRLLSHTVGPAEWDTAAALSHFRGLLAGERSGPVPREPGGGEP